MTNKDTKYFKEDSAIGLKPELLLMLDLAREKAGIPFVINSGLRSIEKNKEVGGVVDSAHLKGLAVDIAVKDPHSQFLVFKGAILAGFERIELAPYTPSWVHLDIDETKEKQIIFFPKKK